MKRRIADPNYTRVITKDERNRGAIEQVAWLAREKRHTTVADEWTAHAILCGWATPVPGIMNGTAWFRVMLTPEGITEAVRNGC